MSHEFRQDARTADPDLRGSAALSETEADAYFGGGTFTKRETIV